MSAQPKERPILFGAEMVRALLAGRKTQTRRVVNPQPLEVRPYLDNPLSWYMPDGTGERDYRMPRWFPGDVLWVQEAHRLACPDNIERSVQCYYEAQGIRTRRTLTDKEWSKLCARQHPVKTEYITKARLIPGRFMYRSLSRLSLRVTDVRVERLQDISEEDAVAEGVEPIIDDGGFPGFRDYEEERSGGWLSARASYRTLWNFLHGPGAWEANPFVWANSFELMEGRAGE